MAQLVKGEAIFLPVSGVLASEAASDILAADDVAQQAIRLFDYITIALVGIGAVEPSPLLAQSGNIFAPQEFDLLRQANAAGDILMRFIDHNGNLIKIGLEKRVISMSLEQLRKVSRAIGVAGGLRKYAAILGALRGWINILVTSPPKTDPDAVIVSGNKLEVRNGKKTKLHSRTDHHQTAGS